MPSFARQDVRSINRNRPAGNAVFRDRVGLGLGRARSHGNRSSDKLGVQGGTAEGDDDASASRLTVAAGVSQLHEHD
jgi:hypothetical protein